MTNEIKKEIDRNKKIAKNSKLFILDKQLVEYKMRSISYDNLPNEFFYGTVYAIKNNSIIEFTTAPVYTKYSMLVDEITEYEPETVVTFKNLILDDLNEFKDTSQFKDIDEMISKDSTTTSNFLLALLRNKFLLYLRKVENLEDFMKKEFESLS